jgi:hypothetical protein
MYQSDYQRSGEQSDLQTQIMQMIMNQRNQGASLSQQLLGMTRGSTTTGTGPDMSGSNALLSTGNAFNNIGTLLSLGKYFQGGGGDQWGSMGAPGYNTGLGSPSPYTGTTTNPDGSLTVHR